MLYELHYPIFLELTLQSGLSACYKLVNIPERLEYDSVTIEYLKAETSNLTDE